MFTRLYDSFKPKSYKLNLAIDSQQLTFQGSVAISGSLTSSSSAIELHAKQLEIASCSVDGNSVDFSLDAEIDVLRLELKEGYKSPEPEVVIEFSGTITDSMHGMYPCYFEHEGKRKRLIATQFESHHAREVFPCVDEPAAKATFDVTLITNENEAVLSNMPVKSQNVDDDKQVTEFETTPLMSTYLLAFVTGEMVFKEAKTKDGVIVRSWASAAQDASWLDYSVKETVDLIEFYNDYFGVPYPLAKCDQVALPDFESGAMENWGLITYRETVLLSDPQNPSLSTQQWITLVVAHELSHQWFGNLVTMQWWDDLWLNESFANMTEYLATDRLHPEWNIWEEFTASDAVSATNRDVYSDVQAVRVAVNNPSEIHTLFDPSIVYAKGGKLLKMLHDLLGDDAWRAGLKDYFEKHAYQNTTRDDLWAALGNHTKLDVIQLMNTWIEKAGQPLVTATQEGAVLKLSQERLLLDGGRDDTVWHIPLLADDLPALLTAPSEEISLPSTNFVKLNTSGIGHYITNYQNAEHKIWLSEQIAQPETETSWKIARLNELTMLAKHGSASLTEGLETIKGCENEQRAMVWSLIGGIISSASILTFEDDTARSSIKQLSGNLAEKTFLRLGWNYDADEASNETHMRTIALGMMLGSERQDVIDQALQLYREAGDAELLPAESRSKLISAAVKFGTEAEFQTTLEAYKSTQNADYRADLCAALTSTKDPDHIALLHKTMLDTKVVRPQDLIRWYIYLLRNRHAREATWHWLKDNWSWIMENFGGSKSYDDFARYSASVLGSKKMLNEYTAFFEPMKTDPALKRAIAVGTEELKARVAWRERDEKNVSAWLKRYSQQNL